MMKARHIIGLVVALDALFFVCELALVASSREALPETVAQACIWGQVDKSRQGEGLTKADLAYCDCLGEEAKSGQSFPAWLFTPAAVSPSAMSKAMQTCRPSAKPDLEGLCLSGALSRFSDRLPPSALPAFCDCVANAPEGSGKLHMKGFQCETFTRWAVSQKKS